MKSFKVLRNLSMLNSHGYRGQSLHLSRPFYYQAMRLFSTSEKPQDASDKSSTSVKSQNEVKTENTCSKEDFYKRQAKFLKEFDDLHKSYFDHFPLRRYAYNNYFSDLDRIFNNEFNRVKKSLFSTDFFTGSKDTKTSDSQKSNDGTDASEKKKPQEMRSVFDLDSFFESPKYVSDVQKMFQEEKKRISQMMKDFENTFKDGDRSSTKNRVIHSIYQRTPEGEYGEFYDSLHPNDNIKFSNKFDSKETRKEALQSKQESAPSDQKSDKCDEKQTAQSNVTTAVHSYSFPSTAANLQSKQEDAKISSEMSDKAKQLSVLLKKDYTECIELTKIYPNKSVGQIIDDILQTEAFIKHSY